MDTKKGFGKAPAAALWAAAVLCAVFGLVLLMRLEPPAPEAPLIIAIAALLCAGLCFFGAGFIRNAKKTPFLRSRWVPGALFTVGLAFCLLLPPLSGPDEPAHYATAYRWSEILLGRAKASDPPSQREIGYVRYATEYRAEDAALIRRFLSDGASEKKNILPYAYGTASVPEGDPVRMETPSYPYTVVGYAPAIAGLTVGRLLGLGAVAAAMLARVFNLAVCALIAGAALRRARFGGEMLLVTALFPMTLHLCASITPDGLMICIALYAFARFTILFDTKRGLTLAAILPFTAAVFLASLIKMYCAPLALLLLLLRRRQFMKKPLRNAAVLIGAGAVCLAVFLGNREAVMSVLRGTAVSYTGDAWTLGEVLGSPLRFLGMFLRSVLSDLPMIACTLPGYSLGAFTVRLPGYAYAAAYLALAAIAAAAPAGNQKDRRLLWCIPIALCALFPAYGSMLLWWTPRQSDRILGVQGRYFLPVTAPALVPLQCAGVFADGRPAAWAAAAAAVLDAAAVLILLTGMIF